MCCYKVYTGPIGGAEIAHELDSLPDVAVESIGTEHVYIDSTLNPFQILADLQLHAKTRFGLTPRDFTVFRQAQS